MKKSFKELFSQGFILGLGMLAPLLFMNLISSTISYKMSSIFYEPEDYSSSYKSREAERIKSLEIIKFQDIRDGNFVMVNGSIKNVGKEKISSIKLEAEFFNANGEFVYEETQNISKTLSPNEIENFSIKCGCQNKTFPEYSKVTVRVVSTSSY